MALHLLQVPSFPIVISPYWDFFSSKEKKFTSGKWRTRSPFAEAVGMGHMRAGGLYEEH